MRIIYFYGWKALAFLIAFILLAFFILLVVFKLLIFLLPFIMVISIFLFVAWLFRSQLLNRIYRKKKPKSKIIDAKFRVKN
ncbi:hypothetical protein D6745_04295 [Candidatus Woesearchaeota archaeon]|nr:MAG: hypothetical protein D6745_04295 [Candidatus Woesearchaeota archaeon]